MNISFDWLKQYVDLEGVSPQELDDLLTFSGLEVDSMEKVETIKGGLEHVVIAQVLTCEPHPDSDHLHLTTVDVGKGEPLHIVCGAPNVAAGQKVVCAQIGTKIYTSDTEYYEIKKGKLRGAVSEGMLCAADELQLGTDHAGIMVLPDDAPVGMPAKEYFHVKDDCLLEVAITANRMDACSHIGVARDVVAVRNTREGKQLKIKWPEVSDWSDKSDSSDKAIRVTVEEPDLCPRYTGITLRNVKVGESPEWLQNRLRTVGLRPINNIVDVTNFVMMEVGQPLHAFDADKIGGGHVIVKRLPQGTKFVTLDGVERELDARDLMICCECGNALSSECVSADASATNAITQSHNNAIIGLLNISDYRIEEECPLIAVEKPELLRELNAQRYIAVFSFIVAPRYRGTRLNYDMLMSIMPELKANYDFVFVPVMHRLKTHRYWQRWGAVEFYRDAECVYYRLVL